MYLCKLIFTLLDCLGGAVLVCVFAVHKLYGLIAWWAKNCCWNFVALKFLGIRPKSTPTVIDHSIKKKPRLNKIVVAVI